MRSESSRQSTSSALPASTAADVRCAALAVPGPKLFCLPYAFLIVAISRRTCNNHIEGLTIFSRKTAMLLRRGDPKGADLCGLLVLVDGPIYEVVANL